MNDIEAKINQVNATMAMEGMPLDEQDKDNLRAVLSGEVSYEKMKKRIVDEYTQVEYKYGT
ncbi:MAG: antitoxin VbhA family protein [Ruminococcus sp.]|jgi:hypothetical protein|nr:antitoxin VbhA family protein [Ruminococcus sp.]